MENVVVFAMVIYLAFVAGVEFVNMILRSIDSIDVVIEAPFMAICFTMVVTLLTFGLDYKAVLAVVAVSFFLNKVLSSK